VPRPRCVLDSGGLTALIGGSERARAWLRWVVEGFGTIVVPTPILVESTTGDAGRDAEVNRILSVLARATGAFRAPGEDTARRAGRLRFRARSDDGIDALVAAEAAGDGKTPCVLLTSDPDDLARLLREVRHVEVRAV
jgi:hypothetical protein